jgi:glycerol-3-phosphate dehydrogenase
LLPWFLPAIIPHFSSVGFASVRWEATLDEIVDLAIIGGGINGCGIARDAAGRGLSVYLCEMNDLASGTSSWSTKLIHGGLRYLEHYEFGLVREALIEREVLWGIAPHIIRPLRFVLPHRKGLRPAWLLRMGLFLYDHIGGRKKLPGTKRVTLASDPTGAPLKAGVFATGFEYSDCFVDDARLVALNAMSARDHRAVIATRSRAVRASRTNDHWELVIEDTASGIHSTVKARALINAAGPWVEQVLTRSVGANAKAKVRLVQGSHIVVAKIFEHDRAYILQNPDGRIVFAIPYQNDFTLIGTTDRDYTGDPADVRATAEEIAYLCDAASQNFAKPVRAADVVWSYSGVRPLYDDGASEAKAATRDYVFELDVGHDRPALLSIFGGKITTYRRLAEEALDRLAAHLPATAAAKLSTKRGWTAQAALPGGDFAAGDHAAIEAKLCKVYPFLRADHARRLIAAYGTRAAQILGSAQSMADLGADYGATLTDAEVRYLVAQEWARSADDIVWRRSKLGLHLTAAQIAALDARVGALMAATRDRV